VLIGFALGLTAVFTSIVGSNATISEYKTLLRTSESRYEALNVRTTASITSLKRTNETLKQSIKTRKITKTDGTVIETSDTSTDTTTITVESVRQTLEIEYERRLAVEKSKHRSQMSKLTHRKLRLGIGYTTEMEYIGRGSYNVYGPISIGGGITSGGTLQFDLGITL